MTKELIYDQGALDRARAEGVSTAKAEGTAALADLQSKLTAATDTNKALVAAFTEVAGADNPRVAVFVEALNDGVAPATAAKFAAKIEAPKAKISVTEPKSKTDAAVDALLAAHTPNVSDNGGGSDANVDPKAARMAELTGSMKAFNADRGYKARG